MSTVDRPDAPPAPRLAQRIKRVAWASAAAQALGETISLLQTVVVARLLTPAEVGLFAAGTVLTAFLAEFTEGGLRSALVNRGHEVDEAAETVFWATLCGGLALCLGSLAAAPLIGLLFDDPTAGWIAAVSSGGLVLYSLANVPEAYLQREFSVWRRLVVGPAVSIAFAGVTIGLAAAGAGVWSLVAGNYASYVTLVVAVWCLCGWRPGRARPSIRLWRELARYGFPLVVGSFAAKARQLAESVVVGRFLDVAALGQYRYGLRIARVPTNALIEIVANALFPAFSRLAADRDRLAQAYLRALGWVTLCSAPVSGLLLAIGEPAAVVVLGEPWRGAGIALVAMAGLGLGKAFASVSEEAIKGSGRTSVINWFTAVEVVLGLGLLLLVFPLGLVGVGLAISMTALVVGVQCVLTARRVLGVRGRDVARATVPAVLAALTAAVVTHALDAQVLHPDQRSTALGVAFLLLDALTFLVLYVSAFTMIMPRTVSELLVSLRRRRSRGAHRLRSKRTAKRTG
ncbi:lipopolysaccharide biosynthesis protein [Pseudonocardia sp. CA-107938]|uniref:lipopolysaccharide biosynthesis protein n=1 Tax=Pseudonocardia sp. CA-107938 TaxID=3240021 RepID=UPI003D93D7DC